MKKALTSCLGVFYCLSSFSLPYAQANLWQTRKSNFSRGTQLETQNKFLDSLRTKTPPALQPYGKIVESWLGPSANFPQVILIQDIHNHYAAQRNAAEILRAMLRPGSSIYVEGAWGPLDWRLMQVYPDAARRKAVARALLQGGTIAGEEYLTIAHPELNFSIVGVEDPQFYRTNLKARQLLDTARVHIQVWIAQVQVPLQKLEDHYYDSATKKYFQLKQRYQQQELSLQDWVQYLSRIVAPQKNSQTEFYLELAKLESARNADNIQKEPLAALQQYLEKSEQLNAEKLREEVGALSQAVEKYLLQDHPQSQKIAELSNQLSFWQRFFSEQFSLEDWQQYESLKKDRVSLVDLAWQIAEEYHAADSAATLDWVWMQENQQAEIALNITQSRTLVENFYRLAVARDRVMANNFLREIAGSSAATVALIAGGFHTAGITQELKKRGISYQVIRPNVIALAEPTLPQKDFDRTSYLDALSIIEKESPAARAAFALLQRPMQKFEKQDAQGNLWTIFYRAPDFLTVFKNSSQPLLAAQTKNSQDTLRKLSLAVDPQRLVCASFGYQMANYSSMELAPSVDARIRNAARQEEWSEVWRLLQNNSTIDAKQLASPTNGTTLLHYAVGQGNLDAVKTLVERYNLTPDQKNKQKTSALDLAAGLGKLDILRYFIIERNVDFRQRNDSRENSILHLAAQYGHVETVEWLVNGLGMDPEKQNDVHKTAMDIALQNNAYNVVKWFLENWRYFLPDLSILPQPQFSLFPIWNQLNHKLREAEKINFPKFYSDFVDYAEDPQALTRMFKKFFYELAATVGHPWNERRAPPMDAILAKANVKTEGIKNELYRLNSLLKHGMTITTVFIPDALKVIAHVLNARVVPGQSKETFVKEWLRFKNLAFVETELTWQKSNDSGVVLSFNSGAAENLSRRILLQFSDIRNADDQKKYSDAFSPKDTPIGMNGIWRQTTAVEKNNGLDYIIILPAHRAESGSNYPVLTKMVETVIAYDRAVASGQTQAQADAAITQVEKKLADWQRHWDLKKEDRTDLHPHRLLRAVTLNAAAILNQLAADLKEKIDSVVPTYRNYLDVAVPKGGFLSQAAATWNKIFYNPKEKLQTALQEIWNWWNRQLSLQALYFFPIEMSRQLKTMRLLNYRLERMTTTVFGRQKPSANFIEEEAFQERLYELHFGKGKRLAEKGSQELTQFVSKLERKEADLPNMRVLSLLINAKKYARGVASEKLVDPEKIQLFLNEFETFFTSDGRIFKNFVTRFLTWEMLQNPKESFSIYSPEIKSSQEEYKQISAHSTALLEAAQFDPALFIEPQVIYAVDAAKLHHAFFYEFLYLMNGWLKSNPSAPIQLVLIQNDTHLMLERIPQRWTVTKNFATFKKEIVGTERKSIIFIGDKIPNNWKKRTRGEGIASLVRTIINPKEMQISNSNFNVMVPISKKSTELLTLFSAAKTAWQSQ